jgi:NTE family protein
VTGQMISILTQQNVDRSLASLGAADVLIKPDLGDITSSDFEHAAETIALGRAAAAAAAAQLRRYSVDEATFQQYLDRQRRPPSPPPRLAAVTVDKHSGLSDALVRSRIDLGPGDLFDESALRAGMAALYGSDDLQRVGFRLQNWRDGVADLDVELEDKGWGVDTLQFGLRLESDFDEASSFQIGVLHTAKRLNSLGAELRTSLLFGSQSNGGMEFYQPLTGAGWLFVAPKVFAADAAADAYSGTHRVATGHVQYVTAGLDVGATLGRFGELRFGVERAAGSVDVEFSVLPITIPKIRFDDSVVRGLFRIDTLDDDFFPRHGMYAAVQYGGGVEQLGADSSYQSLTLTHSQAFAVDSFTAVTILTYDTTLRDSRPFYATPTLGGFLRLSGLPANSLTGQHMAIGTLMLRYQLTGGLASIYLGTSAELGNVWQTRAEQFDSWIFGGSAFVSIDTPLGPISLGAGGAEGGAWTGFLFLGPAR